MLLALFEADEEGERVATNKAVESLALVAHSAKRALDSYDKDLKAPKMRRDYIRYDRE